MLNIILDIEQKEAIDLCCDISQKIVSITGQAGTGKTTIMKQTIENLVEEGIVDSFDDIQCAAPTGRAAQRITEATGFPAMTIHRMLRFTVPEDDKDFGLPAYSKMNPMPYRVLLIDEASMIAPNLRRSLIDAMRRGSVVRFFGDINQLPPIMLDKEKKEIEGYISPFAKDLERFPSVTLSKNYRSTDGIVSVADRIIKNRVPTSNDKVRVIKTPSPIATAVVMDLAKEIDFTHDDNQIIAPTNVTKHGTVRINRLIQQRFNPEKDKINIYIPNKATGKTDVRSFKRGDKIIWDRNDYNIGVMNGTIGRILDFDTETGDMMIAFPEGDKEVPSQMEMFNPTTGEKTFYDPRRAMLLGYAISTHKSQGSQFHRVCYVLSRSRASTRQNVYTAVTRAQENLLIIDIAGALNSSIMNVSR